MNKLESSRGELMPIHSLWCSPTAWQSKILQGLGFLLGNNHFGGNRLFSNSAATTACGRVLQKTMYSAWYLNVLGSKQAFLECAVYAFSSFSHWCIEWSSFLLVTGISGLGMLWGWEVAHWQKRVSVSSSNLPNTKSKYPTNQQNKIKSQNMQNVLNVQNTVTM